jgi:LDH2 family malate/lactate/ureidoglycolate dehydrogenase
MMTNFFASERLHEFASRVFQHFGIPPQDAEQAADILVRESRRLLYELK